MKKINKALISGSLILLITFNIFNFFNFLFHFFMARLLPIAEYGILVALYSIIYILAIFSESIQTVITKYVSSSNDIGKTKNILRKSLKKAFSYSLILLLLYLVISIPLSYMLKIPYGMMALNGLMIIIVFLMPVNRGVLQGRKMFRSLGSNMVLESIIKVTVSILLVWIGWGVYGAIVGTLMGAFLALFLSFPLLKKILNSKEKKAETSEIYNFTKPVFVLMFVILVFYSIDAIIAKIVFSDEIAGYYAIASILAKIVFFGTFPIGKAMFPLSSEKKKGKKNNPENIFYTALGLLFIGIIGALVIFYFFPDLIVRIFSGRQIPESASILFLLAIATSMISLANLNLLYKISQGKIRGYWLFIIFLVIEIGLLFFFSDTLLQFSIAFIASSAMLLWGSIFLLND